MTGQGSQEGEGAVGQQSRKRGAFIKGTPKGEPQFGNIKTPQTDRGALKNWRKSSLCASEKPPPIAE